MTLLQLKRVYDRNTHEQYQVMYGSIFKRMPEPGKVSQLKQYCVSVRGKGDAEDKSLLLCYFPTKI